MTTVYTQCLEFSTTSLKQLLALFLSLLCLISSYVTHGPSFRLAHTFCTLVYLPQPSAVAGPSINQTSSFLGIQRKLEAPDMSFPCACHAIACYSMACTRNIIMNIKSVYFLFHHLLDHHRLPQLF